jgi:hypothetical protein
MAITALDEAVFILINLYSYQMHKNLLEYTSKMLYYYLNIYKFLQYIRSCVNLSKYVYKAMDANGKKLNGSIEADSEEDFKIEIKRLGLYLISYSIWGQSNAIGMGKSISQKELAVICRQFSTMLNAGISVVKCLDILCSQTTNAKQGQSSLPFWKKLKKVRHYIEPWLTKAKLSRFI